MLKESGKRLKNHENNIETSMKRDALNAGSLVILFKTVRSLKIRKIRKRFVISVGVRIIF